MKDIYTSKEKVECDFCKKVKYIWQFSSLRVHGYTCKTNQCQSCFYEEVEEKKGEQYE